MNFIQTITHWPGWQVVYFENTVHTYALSLSVFLVLAVGIWIIRRYLVKLFLYLSKKTHSSLDDTLTHVVSSITPAFFIYLSFYIASRLLVIHPFIEMLMYWLLIVWIVVRAVVALCYLVDYGALRYNRTAKNGSSAVSLVSTFIKIGLWTLGVLMIFSNLGVNVTSLIAGLGIGGIAIALAVQNVLGDLFSYISIHFDRPFEVGDFVTFGTISGTVTKIGVKTTRIKALRGEEVVVPNAQLTSQPINNLKKINERRISFVFGVTYQTDSKKVRAIPEMLKTIMEGIDDVRFDRAHFMHFGESSLQFEVVYYMGTSDYMVYMDRQQEVYLAMKEAFEKKHIEFAYPTQTVFVEKQNK